MAAGRLHGGEGQDAKATGRPPTSRAERSERQPSLSLPVVSARGSFPGARKPVPVSIHGGSPGARWQLGPFLSGSGGQKRAEALLRPLGWAPQGSRTKASRPQPRLAKTWVRLGWGCGCGGVFHALAKPLRGGLQEPSPLPPSPPGPPWRPAACVLAGLGVGGRRGNFKLSGQNVKFTHEFTQQKEGGEARAGTPHARVLSVPTFLPHPPLQPEANPGLGSKACSPHSPKVREPSAPEAGSPKAGPEAAGGGQCPAGSPFTTHLGAPAAALD